MNAPASLEPLDPLETLFEVAAGESLPLPPELATVYGTLRLPLHPDRPHVIGNFVTTLDGVVALNTAGHMSGGAISGDNAHDRLVMGLLRATADAVVVGAGTLRSVPTHRWTASYIYPTLAEEYRALRASLGKPEPPLNVIVTARGQLDLDLPVFRSGEVPVLVVTNGAGAEQVQSHALPALVQVATLDGAGPLGAQAILAAIGRVRRCTVILVEGGPHLMGDFFAERCLDELFLTLAPQIAGRDGEADRPGLVAGKRFAPEHLVWGTLASVRRASSHLFLRYAFETSQQQPS
jgi:riboflavin biosynthesis pyrimidine reductase